MVPGETNAYALFGVAGAESDLVRTAKLPYRPATANHKCVNDPASAYYNRIVDQAAVAQPDWASCENMMRSDQRYFVGAVVAHNAAPPVAGCGSCIFLHVWAAPGMPTAGCTAMSLADMTEIAGWLDGAAAPLLVQLPQAEYERRRATGACRCSPRKRFEHLALSRATSRHGDSCRWRR